MKILISFFVFFISVYFHSQVTTDSSFIKEIDNEVEEFKTIFQEYISKRDIAKTEKKIFIYSFDFSGYLHDIYIPTYKSLVLKKIPDSAVMLHSRLNIKKNAVAYYITQQYTDNSNKAIINVYKSNKQIATVFIDDYNFYKYNLENKTQIFREDINKNHKYDYGYSILTKIQKDLTGYILVAPSYSKRINYSGEVAEHFYEKEFPLSDDDILKGLLMNFEKYSIKLMSGKNYSRGHNQPNKIFDINDREFESDNLKRILNERNNALEGIYDTKEPLLKIRKERAVIIDKRFNDKTTPYYTITIDLGNMREFLFKINPKTGGIESIQYLLMEE